MNFYYEHFLITLLLLYYNTFINVYYENNCFSTFSINFYYEKLLINFTGNTLYFHQIQFTHHCSPAGYTTTLILKIIALARFLLIFIMILF